MALTPDEQLELEQLKAEEAALQKEQEDLNRMSSAVAEKTMPLKVAQPVQEEPDTTLMQDVTDIGSGIVDTAKDVGSTIAEYGTPILKGAAGMGEALTRGAAQDFTLEHADEAEAKATAKVTGEKYEDVLKRIRQQYAQSQKDYPITTAVGGLAGSVAQGYGLSALTGLAGFPVAAAKVASKAGFVTRLVKNALKGSAIGSAMGGVTAYGKSEKTTKKELMKEAKQGAKSGALVGGVLGGIGEVGGTVLKKSTGYISKKIDEGKLPESFKLIRDSMRAGKEGRGFSSSENKMRLLQEPKDIAENVIRPKMDIAMNEIRELRDFIVDNADGFVDVNTPYEKLMSTLNAIGFDDATSLARGIKKNYESIISKTPSGTISLKDANKFSKEIRDKVINDANLSATTKSAVISTSKDIGNLVNARVPEDQAIRIIIQEPEMLNRYRTYLKNVSVEEIADAVKKKFNFKEGWKYDNAALKAAEAMKAKLAKIGTDTQLTRTQYEELIEAMKYINPIKKLDSKMHNIMNASEILGDTIRGRTQAEVISDVEKIFKNLVSQPKDSADAFLNRERFAAAMKNLRTELPDLVDEIEARVAPLVKDTEISRYIRGEGFEKAGGEQGILKKTVGDLGRITAEAGNIFSQAKAAARKGVDGPVVGLPSSVLYKPDVVVLNKFKTNVDRLLSKSPDNKVYSTASTMIQKAIDSQDASRRAATLNTLMQYEFFRNMTKSENKE